nr:hypothetical protein [Tanacetum cinerariifolium]
VSTVSVPISSGIVPTASPIFTTASVVTPYSRQKGEEKIVESDTPKKKKLQEHIDVQVVREMEEQLAEYKEVTAAQVEVSAAQELQENIQRSYLGKYCKPCRTPWCIKGGPRPQS